MKQFKNIFIGIVIGILLVFGYNYIQDNRIFEPGFTSITYNQFNTVTENGATSTCLSCAGVRVLDRNDDRQYALITNDSSNVIWLSLATTTSDKTVVPLPNEGIRLNASGGSYEIKPENMFTGDVWATSTTAGGGDVILIIEK